MKASFVPEVARRGQGRRVALACWVASALGLAFVLPAGAAAASWSIVPSANAQVSNGSLAALSCWSESGCVAVGRYANASAGFSVLAEVLDASGWSLSAAPDPPSAHRPELLGVSCPGADDCVAVGTYFTAQNVERAFSEFWDGSGWVIRALPAPAGSSATDLRAVSCASASSCVAVGDYLAGKGQYTLAERWNGVGWAVLRTPNPAGGTRTVLSGVDCTGASACMAVGTEHYRALDAGVAERWSGSGWTLVTLPFPADAQFGPTSGHVNGVSCSAANACSAVGNYLTNEGLRLPLIERWNGSSWQAGSAHVNQADGELDAVSCPNSNCVGVGADGLGAYAAGGSSESSSPWGSIKTAASGSSCCSLKGVYCFGQAANVCWAVGQPYSHQTLVEKLGPSVYFTPQPSPGGLGDTESGLASVSCASGSVCVAVGSGDTGPGGVPEAYADGWNGTSWSSEAMPSPSGSYESYLNAVSCAAPAMCMAVGLEQSTNSQAFSLIAARWNGTGWTIQTMPEPTNEETDITGISCPAADDCVTVGSYYPNPTGEPKAGTPFAEVWNGSSWTTQTVPVPAGVIGVSLWGISCSAVGACTAVGIDRLDAGNYEPAAERWNGSSWTFQSMPQPAGAFEPMLVGVSCSTGANCMAVGSTDPDTEDAHVGVPLAENWNGRTWGFTAVPTPANGSHSILNGVSCTTASACIAVGEQAADTSSPATLGARWDGTSWTLQNPRNRAAGKWSELKSVACPTATSCEAVGIGSNTVIGLDLTFAEQYH